MTRAFFVPSGDCKVSFEEIDEDKVNLVRSDRNVGEKGVCVEVNESARSWADSLDIVVEVAPLL
jgi:hypothetical protein